MRNSPTATSKLAIKTLCIQFCLHGFYVCPICIQFFCNNHGERCEYILPKLRVWRHDGDSAIRGNRQVAIKTGTVCICLATHVYGGFCLSTEPVKTQHQSSTSERS